MTDEMRTAHRIVWLVAMAIQVGLIVLVFAEGFPATAALSPAFWLGYSIRAFACQRRHA